jgi:hypothetical protein
MEMGDTAGAPSPPPVEGHALGPYACSWKRSLTVRAAFVFSSLNGGLLLSSRNP